MLLIRRVVQKKLFVRIMFIFGGTKATKIKRNLKIIKENIRKVDIKIIIVM